VEVDDLGPSEFDLEAHGNAINMQRLASVFIDVSKVDQVIRHMITNAVTSPSIEPSYLLIVDVTSLPSLDQIHPSATATRLPILVREPNGFVWKNVQHIPSVHENVDSFIPGNYSCFLLIRMDCDKNVTVKEK
jgi:hypothetical protein